MEDSNIVRALLAAKKLPTIENINDFKQKQLVSVNKKAETQKGASVEILTNIPYSGQKIEPSHFVKYFRNRFIFYRNLFLARPELSNICSISKLQSNEKAVIVASIFDMKKLPTGSIKLILEDLTGQVQAIISSKNQDLIALAKSFTLDEILAFKGTFGKGTFFVDEIIWPDIPPKRRATVEEEVYLVCASDLHIGSNKFLQKPYEKFVKWLNGKYGNAKQKELAKKVKYVVFTGDIVDGIGIYPGQEKELTITDIYKQYDSAAKFLSQISSEINIIIQPGNHDAIRLCEPQPIYWKDLAAPLYDLPNVFLAPNPSYVRIHAIDGPGVELLLYHGYSFDYFVDAIEALREAGGYSAADKLWEFLLKRRHLAPTYGSTLALPLETDPLVINKVPDIAISGHIHKSKIGQYRGVLTISSSCFQDTTTFQLRMGHTPTPGKIPIVNLKTGAAKTLLFA
ncbi:MAG: metallophosphoesterase [Candidatus Nanoarchaeia archaeon]